MNLAQIERLPDWPARMTAPVAAAYMGIGTSTFIERYRGCAQKEGANTLWARAQLDALIAAQFGLAQQVDTAPEDPYARWKSGIEG